LCQAFDAACLVNGDPSVDATTIAKAIIGTYEQGVTDKKELVEGAILSAANSRLAM
jgi:hypothetical protein